MLWGATVPLYHIPAVYRLREGPRCILEQAGPRAPTPQLGSHQSHARPNEKVSSSSRSPLLKDSRPAVCGPYQYASSLFCPCTSHARIPLPIAPSLFTHTPLAPRC